MLVLEPFFLPVSGDNSASLFALWQQSETEPHRVWVLCPPFAEEEKSARRVLNDVVRSRISHNEAALLVSLRGCGDSSGDFALATLEQWRDDLRAACVEARRRAPQATLGLLGVRLGATLALQIAAQVEARELVCIEPVLNGRQYLSAINQRKRLRAMMTQHERGNGTSATEATASASTFNAPAELENIEDADGWPLGAALRADLETLDVSGFNTSQWSENSDMNIHVLQVGPREQLAPPLQRWCESLGSNVHARAVVMQPFWNLLDYAAPAPLLQALDATLSAEQ